MAQTLKLIVPRKKSNFKLKIDVAKKEYRKKKTKNNFTH